MAQPPENNEIVEGQWFAGGETEGVSVEAELAGRLGLELGDRLTFTVGSERVTEPVTRSVPCSGQHEANFYMAFPGGALSDLPATWITSFYLPEDRKTALNASASSRRCRYWRWITSLPVSSRLFSR